MTFHTPINKKVSHLYRKGSSPIKSYACVEGAMYARTLACCSACCLRDRPTKACGDLH